MRQNPYTALKEEATTRKDVARAIKHMGEDMNYAEAAETCEQEAVTYKGHPEFRDFYDQLMLAATVLRQLASGEKVLCDGEPGAWMRNDGVGSIATTTDVITKPVRDLWLKANPRQIERYTIPLYAAATQGEKP